MTTADTGFSISVSEYDATNNEPMTIAMAAMASAFARVDQPCFGSTQRAASCEGSTCTGWASTEWWR
jgi:hypothetical protein